MAEKINIRRQGYKGRQRQVQTYGTQTPLSSTAVERGSTRWLNGSTVVIEGLLDVTGTASISGALNVSGSTTLSGSTTIAGPTGITGALTIAGQLDVTGPTTLAGTLDITGDTTLSGDMTVSDGGLIKVGPNMTLTPVAGGGSIEFANGSGLASSGNSAELFAGGSALSVGSSAVQINAGTGALIDLFADGDWAIAGGGGSIHADGGGVLGIDFTTVTIGSGADKLSATSSYARIGSESHKFQAWNGIGISVKGLLSTTLPPNLYVDANGWLYKSTWTP